MPGPRRDKDDAWNSIRDYLKAEDLWVESMTSNIVIFSPDDYKAEIVNALKMLRASGRMDARQVKMLKMVIKLIVRAIRPNAS